MAKRAESTYVSGNRSPDWLKIKTAKRQEVVVVGFTAPKPTRPFFGALVLAVRGENGWRYVGRVGTGFSHKALQELHTTLAKLKSTKSPFPTKVKDKAVTTWVTCSVSCSRGTAARSVRLLTLMKCGNESECSLQTWRLRTVGGR
jgi:bifunctional non-homologous end joining protein LigD